MYLLLLTYNISIIFRYIHRGTKNLLGKQNKQSGIGKTGQTTGFQIETSKKAARKIRGTILFDHQVISGLRINKENI
jgi:hypothetical protein